MRFTIAAAVLMISCSPSLARSKPACHMSGGSYVNSSGQTVSDPVCGSGHMSGETAICRDGSHSFSKHHSGTCSGHGGVATWE